MSLLSGVAQTIILVGHAGRAVVSKRRVSDRLSRLRLGTGESGVADCAADPSSGGELRPLSHVDAMVRSCPYLFRGDELPAGPMAAPQAQRCAVMGRHMSERAAARGLQVCS